MDALASSPLPSPLSDLTRDGVLPQEGGRRPPWRLLPLLLPLAFVSGPSRHPQVDVRDRGGTRSVGSVPPVKSDYETRRRRDSEGRARTPIEARAALAGSLLESLDVEVDQDAEAAWAIEVNRRLAELDSGAVKMIPWAEVRRRLAAF